MAWKTQEFVNNWVEGTLNRKKVHSVFRRIVGDHCEVLVKSTKDRGITIGTNLIGIKMSAVKPWGAKLDLVFYHSLATNQFNYCVLKELDLHSAPALPWEILDEGDTNILDSGIIDWSSNKVLIEVGDKPYLLTFREGINDSLMFWTSPTGSIFPKFSTCDRVNNRVATVAEAEAQLVLPADLVNVLGHYYAKPMPIGFEPPQLVEEKAALQQSMNPFDFGFKDWECEVIKQDYPPAVHGIQPNAYTLKDSKDPRVIEWNIAKDKSDHAANVLSSRLPRTYGNISIMPNRYSPNDSVGVIVRTTQGVFIKGTVHNTKRWEDKFEANTWYKIDRPSFTIKLRG